MKTFIVCIMLLTTTFSAKAQYSTPGNNKSWTLDSLVVYSAGVVTGGPDVYSINQNLTISLSDTFYIMNDVSVRIAASCLVTVNGTMRVNPPGEVVFTAVDSNSNYTGFRFENASASVIRNARFEFGGGNKVIGSMILFEQCTFRKNSSGYASGALDLFQCSPVIRFCTFFLNNRSAIMTASNANASPKIIGNHIFHNDVSNGNYPQINLGLGSSDTLIVRDNIIEGLYTNAGGIGISNLSGTGQMICRVENNYVFNNRYGMAFLGYPLSGLVAGNRIENNNIQGNPNLGGSGINFNGNLTTNQLIVSNNIIRGNLWGITIQGKAQPNLGDISQSHIVYHGHNRIFNNGNTGKTYALYNNTRQPIKAENNFWGSVIRDSVEQFIVHTADIDTLGFVDYLPIWDTTNAPSSFLDTVTLAHDTIHVGDEKFNQLVMTNIGNQDLRLTLKDTFGIQTEKFGSLTTGKNGMKIRQRNLWNAISRIRNLQVPSAFFELSNVTHQSEGTQAVVVTDPANDFFGRPHQVPGLTYPDITSINITITSSFLTTLNCTTTYNAPIDTNMVGVISLDTDQDFMTGMYPPLANLGAVPSDVGSEYELILTTKPSLYFQYNSLLSPAVLIKWDGDSIAIAGAATSITRSGNDVRFTIIMLAGIDNDNNINISSGVIEVDSTFDIFSYQDYEPKRIPDVAPDIGHGRLGTEKDPSWLGIEVKSDTLFPEQTSSFQFVTLGSALPGQYLSTVILKSNDPIRPVIRFPYTLTVLPELQPQVNPSSLAITDSVIEGTIKIIQAVLNNTGEGIYRYFIADTAETPWLSLSPRAGIIAPGTNAVISVTIDASDLIPGNYSAQWLVISSDTMNTKIVLPVNITVLPSVGISEEPRRPLKYELYPNYPNPFNPSTTIRYQLAESGDVFLKIYNTLGQEVRTLVQTKQAAGSYSVIWDGKDNRGKAVGSGVYICRLETGHVKMSKKMMMLR